MDSMAVLLEAAAEDIKLIDCLGPEDLCLDPSSADGLKPLHGLRPRSNRTAATAGVAAAVQSVIGYPQAPSLNRRKLIPVSIKGGGKDQVQAPTQAVPVPTTAMPATAAAAAVPVATAAEDYGSANATLAAAISAGDFCAPSSPSPPASKRPVPTPAATPVSPKGANRPSTRRTPNKIHPPLHSVAAPACVAKPPSRGSSAQPLTRVQRFAACILQYIRGNLKAGKTETLESVIRREFGNNPDISKALRLLVSEKNVKRVGRGGRVDPFTYQLAAKALKTGQDDEPSSDTAHEEDVADNSGSAVASIEQAPAVRPAPNTAAAAAAGAAVTHETAVMSDMPLRSSSLRRSASLPSNLSSLAPIYIPPGQDSLPVKPNSQQRSLTDVLSKPEGVMILQNPYAKQLSGSGTTEPKTEDIPMPQNPYTKQLSSSGAAELKPGVLAGLQSAYSMPGMSLLHMAPVSTASGVGLADSSMSNSPKESTASVVWNNPFQTRTNTEDGSGGRVAIRNESKLGAVSAVGTITKMDNRCFGAVSTGVADDKENSAPGAGDKRGSSYNPRGSQGSVSMAGNGSMKPPPSVPTLGNARQTVGNSGTASALSGTASGHALSANIGVGGNANPKEPQGWDVSKANMREGVLCANSTVQGLMTSEGSGNPVEATASKRAKLTHLTE